MNNRIKLCSTLGNLSFLVLIGNIIIFTSAYAADLNLAWDASPSSNLGGYKLYYGTSSKNYTSAVKVGNVLTYKMTGLDNGKTYYLALKSYNAAGTLESASYSNEVKAVISTTPPSSVSSNLTANMTLSATSGAAPFTVTATPVTTGKVDVLRWDFPGSSTPKIVYNPANFSAQKVTYTKPGTYKLWLNAYGNGTNWLSTKLITVTAAASTSIASTAIAPTTTTSSAPKSAAISINTNGLVAAYSFEDANTSQVTDTSGKGNHGSSNGAARNSSGFIGQAMAFNGVNNMVSINDNPSLDLTTGSTLEAWVKPAATMNNWITILMKEQPGDEVYSLYANSDKNNPTTGVSIGGKVGSLSGGNSLPANQWTHLAATYDGNFQRLYINGTLVSSRSQTGSIQQSGNALRIGGNAVWGEYFKGLIDEVLIYNRALSDQDIKQYYDQARALSNNQ